VAGALPQLPDCECPVERAQCCFAAGQVLSRGRRSVGTGAGAVLVLVLWWCARCCCCGGAGAGAAEVGRASLWGRWQRRRRLRGVSEAA
jgi:hypothetical protein